MFDVVIIFQEKTVDASFKKVIPVHAVNKFNKFKDILNKEWVIRVRGNKMTYEIRDTS